MWVTNIFRQFMIISPGLKYLNNESIIFLFVLIFCIKISINLIFRLNWLDFWTNFKQIETFFLIAINLSQCCIGGFFFTCFLVCVCCFGGFMRTQKDQSRSCVSVVYLTQVNYSNAVTASEYSSLQHGRLPSILWSRDAVYGLRVWSVGARLTPSGCFHILWLKSGLVPKTSVRNKSRESSVTARMLTRKEVKRLVIKVLLSQMKLWNCKSTSIKYEKYTFF